MLQEIVEDKKKKKYIWSCCQVLRQTNAEDFDAQQKMIRAISGKIQGKNGGGPFSS